VPTWGTRKINANFKKELGYAMGEKFSVTASVFSFYLVMWCGEW
jgi:hypothetical protein